MGAPIGYIPTGEVGVRGFWSPALGSVDGRPGVSPGTLCQATPEVQLMALLQSRGVLVPGSHLTDKCREGEVRGWACSGLCGPHSCGLQEHHSTRDLHGMGRLEGSPWQACSWSLVPPAPASTHLPFCSQISPQVYQSLCFTDLTPIQHPDFLMHKVLDQEGRHIRWVASDIRRELESIRCQIFTDVAASSTPIASPSSLSLGASASRVLESTWSTSLRPHSSVSLLRPWSASPAQSSSSTSPQTLSQPRRSQKASCQLLPASCSIRSSGEPPSCSL